MVVGIGVNVRRSAFPPEIADRATAVEMETDRAVDGAAVTVEILAALAEVMETLADGRGEDVVSEWRTYARAALGGAPIRWNDERGLRHGFARDVDGTGALVVDAGGREERLVAGEVHWERLSRG